MEMFEYDKPKVRRGPKSMNDGRGWHVFLGQTSSVVIDSKSTGLFGDRSCRMSVKMTAIIMATAQAETILMVFATPILGIVAPALQSRP